MSPRSMARSTTIETLRGNCERDGMARAGELGYGGDARRDGHALGDGPRRFEKLNGIGSPSAIYDRAQRRCFLFRDRLGWASSRCTTTARRTTVTFLVGDDAVTSHTRPSVRVRSIARHSRCISATTTSRRRTAFMPTFGKQFLGCSMKSLKRVPGAKRWKVREYRTGCAPLTASTRTSRDRD